MQACRDGREEAARHALTQGASANAKIHGKSCLCVAGEYGGNEIVQLLLRAGADPNEIVDRKGNTLINWAAAQGNFGFVVELLKYKADPLIPNRDGKTALLTACHGDNEFLLDRLVSVTGQISDEHGNSPLHEAAQFGAVGMCALLLSHGAFIDRQNKAGVTPLYAATSSGRHDIVNLLRAHGADDTLLPHPVQEDESKQRPRQLMIDFDSADEQPTHELVIVSKVAESARRLPGRQPN